MSTLRRAPRPEGAPARTAKPKPAAPRPAVRATPRPAPPEASGDRLSKRVMALKGCSRNEAEQYIEGGWVMVDGVVVEDPPFRVLRQQVLIDPAATLIKLPDVTLVLHKPPGWLDGVEEDDGDDGPARPQAPGKGARRRAQNARALLVPDKRFTQDASGVRPLKRHLLHLEADVPLETGASGLVVFTQDWRTTRKLREDMGTMEHELIASVAGAVQPDQLQRIAKALEDTRNRLPHTRFSVNSNTPEQTKLRFAVKGAHPGLVAHLCGKAGLELQALRRIRLGRVALSDLPEGQWRYLGPHEKF